MRYFSPSHINIEAYQDILFKDNTNDITINPIPLKIIVQKIKNITEIKKKSIRLMKKVKFMANAYKSIGFVKIKVFPKNVELEDVMIYYKKVITRILFPFCLIFNTLI